MAREIVRRVGQDQEIELLIRLHERIDERDGVCGMDVVVEISVDEKELPLEIAGEGLVGRRREVVRAVERVLHQQSLKSLPPSVVIGSVVVIAGRRHRDLEEVWIA